jgi:hypothetical protein
VTWAGRPRRAAGSRTLTDVLRVAARRHPARPETDIRDPRAGVALRVSAFARRDGWFRQGWLVLDPGAADPVVWQAYRARRPERLPVPGPYRVWAVTEVAAPDRRWVKDFLFRVVVLDAGAEHWELAVPTVDVPLVRAALA